MIKGIHYNYNVDMCNWLFKRGISPIGCGTHEKTNNVFIIFLVNDRYKELCDIYKKEN